MVVLLAKITNRENVDKIFKNEPFTHNGINILEKTILVGMPVFLVFSGDKAKIDWPQGLIGVGKILKAPFDKGYDKKNKKNFCISIQPILVLNKPLDPKFTKLHPIYRNELYDVPYVGANHFPNQAIAQSDGEGAIALFKLLKEQDTSNKLQVFKDYIVGPTADKDLKKEFKNYLLKKNKPTTAGFYISALEKLPEYLKRIEKPSGFEWSLNVDINSIKKSAEFVQNESKKENGGLLSKYKPKSHYDSWYFSGINNFISFLSEITVPIKESNSFDIELFSNTLFSAGLIFNKFLVKQFVASLISKKFAILTGLSGSGKTKLAQAFVKWICQDESQYRIVPVGADWTNREPLLGYPNAIEPDKYVKPDSGVLDLIIQANSRHELPHFLILDEMNLSHVERYFADFLSVMESKEEILLHAESSNDNGVPAKLPWPSNLFIIGTVNIDETTNMFSPKVLDRANTIEFRVSEEEMNNFLGNTRGINMEVLNTKGAVMAKSFLQIAANVPYEITDLENIRKILVKFFTELKKTGAEFGYRSASEILRLIHQLGTLDKNLSVDEKIDIAIMQKLLPKLHGSRRKLCPVLETLGAFCISEKLNVIKDVFEKEKFDFRGQNVLYPLSLEKITRMYKGAVDNGFASFAEA